MLNTVLRKLHTEGCEWARGMADGAGPSETEESGWDMDDIPLGDSLEAAAEQPPAQSPRKPVLFRPSPEKPGQDAQLQKRIAALEKVGNLGRCSTGPLSCPSGLLHAIPDHQLKPRSCVQHTLELMLQLYWLRTPLHWNDRANRASVTMFAMHAPGPVCLGYCRMYSKGPKIGQKLGHVQQPL